MYSYDSKFKRYYKYTMKSHPAPSLLYPPISSETAIVVSFLDSLPEVFYGDTRKFMYK